jgi:hypothetical protein
MNNGECRRPKVAENIKEFKQSKTRQGSMLTFAYDQPIGRPQRTAADVANELVALPREDALEALLLAAKQEPALKTRLGSTNSPRVCLFSKVATIAAGRDHSGCGSQLT